MATHRVWLWSERGIARAETDRLPGIVVDAPTSAAVEEVIRARIRQELGDPRPRLDVRYTTGHERRAARVREQIAGARGELLAALIDAYELDQYADEIVAGSKPAVLIKARRVRPAVVPALGGSRFGGHPDLPPDAPWPTSRGRPLAMLAQIRLSELPEFPPGEAADLALPRAGLLWFWYDIIESPWNSARGDSDDGFRVMYCANESEPLVRRSPPRALLETGYAVFHPCELTMRRIVSLPWPDYACAKGERDRWYELREQVEGGTGDWHYLRGNHGAGNDSTPEEHPDAELLASIASDHDGPGWQWGDCGEIHFWIGRDNRTDFATAWGAIDST